MNAHEAAKLIGCTPAQVRWLIRKGKLRARRMPLLDSNGKKFGYSYQITETEARRQRDKPQNQKGGGGCPRVSQRKRKR